MKIAQIVCAYPPYAGGIGNSAHQLAEILTRQHNIDTFTPDNTRPLLRRGHGAILPQLLFRLKKYDTIYLHYPFFGTAEIVWLYRLFNRRQKLIIHYHMDVQLNSWFTKILSWPSLLIRSSLLKKADIIVSSSLDYIKNSQISHLYHRYPEKFKEIPFSVDIYKYQPKDINRPSANNIIAKAKDLVKKVNALFIKKDRLDLIFVGALDSAHYFKGVDILIKALSIIDHKSWRLVIVGEGDKRKEYEELAISFNFQGRIEFKGKLNEEDLIRALQDSDLLILPSINKSEAFGLVLIEALACGLPVIASDLPGVRSVFNNNQEGLLVRPGEIADLAEKINFFAQNEKKRQEMAKAARRLAEKKYDRAKMITAYENLFNK